MADKKISELTGAGALTGTEEVPIVQGGVTVKTTTQDIADLGSSSTRIPKTASYTAVNNEDYANNGTITVTDPTGVANLGYTVLVVSGTTTINSVAYTEGDLIYRFFDGTTWESYLINGGATPTLQEVTDAGNETTLPIKVAELQLLNAPEGDYLQIIANEDEILFNESANTSKSISLDRSYLTSARSYLLPNINGTFNAWTEQSTNFTAFGNGVFYRTSGTLTITDPSSPMLYDGYIVFVVSGTTTIDGVGYTANKLVYRFYNGTSWTSTVINGGGASWGGITGTLSDQTDLAGYLIPTASTGNSVSFDKLRVYNYGSPATGNITEDLTGAKPAIVQVFYHQQATAFTVPAGWVLIGGEFSTTLVNKIFVEWITGSVSHYWIAQIP